MEACLKPFFRQASKDTKQQKGSYPHAFMVSPLQRLVFGAERFPIHHLPRRDGGFDCASVFAAVGAVDHPQAY